MNAYATHTCAYRQKGKSRLSVRFEFVPLSSCSCDRFIFRIRGQFHKTKMCAFHKKILGFVGHVATEPLATHDMTPWIPTSPGRNAPWEWPAPLRTAKRSWMLHRICPRPSCVSLGDKCGNRTPMMPAGRARVWCQAGVNSASCLCHVSQSISVKPVNSEVQAQMWRASRGTSSEESAWLSLVSAITGLSTADRPGHRCSLRGATISTANLHMGLALRPVEGFLLKFHWAWNVGSRNQPGRRSKMCWICSFKPVITVLPYLVGDTGSIPHSAVTFQNDFSNAYNWWIWWIFHRLSQAFGASSHWKRLQDRAVQSLGFRDLQGGVRGRL